MSRREAFSFVLQGEDLDQLRAALLAAQEHHLDRARHWRRESGPGCNEAARDAVQAADRCRRLWALLAGVRCCRCEGSVPVGDVARDDLLAFLDGR